jgi:hypothetical protein
MEQCDLLKGLRSLSESLRQLETLVAWAGLERSESRPHDPPSFRFDNHTATDIRTEYSFFIKTAMDIHDILNSTKVKNVAEKKRQQWRRRLKQLETELHRLNLPLQWPCARLPQ